MEEIKASIYRADEANLANLDVNLDDIECAYVKNAIEISENRSVKGYFLDSKVNLKDTISTLLAEVSEMLQIQVTLIFR